MPFLLPPRTNFTMSQIVNMPEKHGEICGKSI